MAAINTTEVADLLQSGPFRQDIGRKQLTLAFGGLWIASTTASAKPYLVWEVETGYPRYYIPTESLHQDIQAKLAASGRGETNGTSASSVEVETVDTIKGKGSDSEAVIERLSVGSRTTTWVRFVNGPLNGLVRFERAEIDDWFENGGIFNGIKNPFKRIDTTAVARDIVVKVDGEVVAQTPVAVLLNETGLKEMYYLPATSIKSWGAIEKSDLRTVCPYKGESWYLSITVKGKKYDNLIWYYPYPTHESAGVEGFICFYNKEGVDILVDGVKV